MTVRCRAARTSGARTTERPASVTRGVRRTPSAAVPCLRHAVALSCWRAVAALQYYKGFGAYYWGSACLVWILLRAVAFTLAAHARSLIFLRTVRTCNLLAAARVVLLWGANAGAAAPARNVACVTRSTLQSQEHLPKSSCGGTARASPPCQLPLASLLFLCTCERKGLRAKS